METLSSGTGLRTVFFISDRTGLTAESYGKSLLAQFPGLRFKRKTLSFIDNPEKAQLAAGELNQVAIREGVRPIVFTTLVDEESRALVESSGALVLNLLNTFIGPLEEELGRDSAHTLGNSHDIFGDQSYQRRLDAVDYALAHDDGVRPDQYDQSDVILVGVSRCGKTPTSLLLAMNFSLKACNYPLTDEELERDELPKRLKPWRSKIAGLSIDVRTLAAIRQKRRASSHYASESICRREVKAAERMFEQAGIPVFDTTNTSIEEIASSIIRALKLLDR